MATPKMRQQIAELEAAGFRIVREDANMVALMNGPVRVQVSMATARGKEHHVRNAIRKAERLGLVPKPKEA